MYNLYGYFLLGIMDSEGQEVAFRRAVVSWEHGAVHFYITTHIYIFMPEKEIGHQLPQALPIEEKLWTNCDLQAQISNTDLFNHKWIFLHS